MSKSTSGTGFALLYTFLKDKDASIGFFADHGISDEDFQKDEREVYEFIVGFIRKFGKKPTPRTVETELDVELRNYPNEPIEYWVEGLRKRNVERTVRQTFSDIKEDFLSGDHDEAISKLQALAATTEYINKPHIIMTLSKAGAHMIKEHDRLQKEGRAIPGVPFGLPFLDEVSGGAKGGDLHALVGRPEMGKSFFLDSFVLSARGAKYKPLLVGFEMQNIQTVSRLYGLMTNINSKEMSRGRLSTYARDKVIDKIKEIAEEEKTEGIASRVFEGSLITRISDLQNAVVELTPDVLYVDGAYLIKDQEGSKSVWERVTNVATALKDIAKRHNIPVIATYQFNRAGPGNLANIGLSDAVGQLSSIVLSLEDWKSDGYLSLSGETYKLLKIIKGREGEKGHLKVLYDMKRMKIEQVEVVEL